MWDRSEGKRPNPSKSDVTDQAEEKCSDDLKEASGHKNPSRDDMSKCMEEDMRKDMRDDIGEKNRRVRDLVGMGMNLEDASELEEEERHREVRERRRHRDGVETRM